MPNIELVLPKMGESISEATIINWSVSEGDQVQQDETVLEVATDKVDSEVPAPVNGIIKEILVHPDEVVKVGQVLAIIEASSDQSVATTSSSDKKEEKQSPKKANINPAKSVLKKQKISSSSNKSYTLNENQNTYFSPLIQQIAKDYHISFEELARIPATGHEGRLKKSDVFKYIE